jgi:CBS domain-containing protein
MNTPVRELLEKKGGKIFSIGPTRSVFEAIQTMADFGVGCLLVTNKQDKVLGILSERDFIRKVILKDKSAHKVQVRTIMSKKVTSVEPDTTVEECMQMMTEKRIRHLPVVKKGQVIGMLSIGDLVKFMVTEKDLMIQNLEKYIEGSL